MGDHRASVKIEFSMHGHEDRVDFWINWSPDINGVDERVTKWLANAASRALDKFHDEQYEAEQEPIRAHFRDVQENGT